MSHVVHVSAARIDPTGLRSAASAHWELDVTAELLSERLGLLFCAFLPKTTRFSLRVNNRVQSAWSPRIETLLTFVDENVGFTVWIKEKLVVFKFA